MVVIKGINKTTLLDYPPYTAATIFLSGCNFRCGFCHNPELVVNFHLEEDIPESEIFEYLEKRKGWIDGVCITGGEPTLQHDLLEFAKKLKEKGILVKVDTNGTNPGMLKRLIEEKLVDRVAMDIKSSKEKYEDACSCKVDLSKIQASIDLLKGSDIEYEFRTTVVSGLVDEEDIDKIGQWIGKAKNFAIQNFRATGNVLDKSYKNIAPYTLEELNNMKSIAEKYFDKVVVRE